MMIFLWEKSGIEVEAAQKILYIFAVNATLSKKERETSTISISKVGNWVFISPKSFLLLDLLQIFEEDYHLSDFRRRKKNNRALHTDAEKLKKKTAKNQTIHCFLCNFEVVFRGRISYFPKFHLYLLSY